MENTADYDTESFQYNTLLGPAGMQIVFITKIFAGPRVRVRLLFPITQGMKMVSKESMGCSMVRKHYPAVISFAALLSCEGQSYIAIMVSTCSA